MSEIKRDFGVFSGSEGLGDIPTSRKQASVYTDALLAKNENNKITEGGDEE